MRRKLAVRVASLEKAMAALSATAEPPPLWLLTLMAVELGNLLPHEPISQGYARALGYADLQALRSGLAERQVGEPHGRAVRELLAAQPTTVLIARDRGELERRLT